MTNALPQNSATTDAPRILLPGIAILLFIAGPVLIVLGLFLAQPEAQLLSTNADLPFVGTVMFWIGVAALVIAVILEGVRAIAQQHLMALLRDRAESE